MMNAEFAVEITVHVQTVQEYQMVVLKKIVMVFVMVMLHLIAPVNVVALVR